MRTSIFNVFILFIFSLGHPSYINAQNTSLVKTMEQSFDVNTNPGFELSNKYGDIVINGWERNEVYLKIQLTTYGKDDESARKMMDRVEFDFNVSKEYVVVETILDRKKGVLSEFFTAISDYSKSLLNKNEMDIDFEVNLPFGSSVEINNKFGDIVINDINGKLVIEQSHGNFKSGNIHAFSRINVSYGNIDINDFNDGNISIKGGELELKNAGRVDITSSSSQLLIKQISHLKLSSTSDKIRISEAESVLGNSGFSNIDIYRLTNSCHLNQSYGELIIHSVEASFQDIKLTGKSTDYNLSFIKGSSFVADIKAREDKLILMDLPKEAQKNYLDDKQKLIHLMGYYGNHSEPTSSFQLDTSNGEIIIDFINTTK